MRRTSPLIVGGGPAGAAAAITLALGGAAPIVLERTTAPHDPVCGGFLGWDALAALARLGVDPWALGAHPIDRVSIFAGNSHAAARLPHRAAGMSRRTLDAALLAEAERLGVDLRRGATARRVDGDGVHLADGTSLPADDLFLATGKYELRGSPRGAGKRARVGLRTTLTGDPALTGTIELHLLEGGYAGLLLQDDGRINLTLSIASERLARAGGSPQQLIATLAREAPRLIERIGVAPDNWSAIAAVPYGWRVGETVPGRYRIGDQAAVIASLAGDGIAIALASGRAAGAAWLDGGAAGAPGFQRDFARRASRPIGTAEMLRHAAERPALARPLVGMLGVVPAILGIAARFTRIGA